MLHVVSRPSFRTRYDNAKDKTHIDSIIATTDRPAFDKWMKNDLALCEMSIRELRLKAASLHVTGYSRLDKGELIRILNANT